MGVNVWRRDAARTRSRDGLRYIGGGQVKPAFDAEVKRRERRAASDGVSIEK